jgi:hypothetical protein
VFSVSLPLVGPQGWVEGLNQSPADAVRILVQLSVGGPALGVGMGIATTLWLRFMFNNPLVIPCPPAHAARIDPCEESLVTASRSWRFAWRFDQPRRGCGGHRCVDSARLGRGC